MSYNHGFGTVYYAIETEYIPATDDCGALVMARWATERVTVSFDTGEDTFLSHVRAAKAVVDQAEKSVGPTDWVVAAAGARYDEKGYYFVVRYEQPE